jgi:DNA-binding NtrC family response regulator
MSIGRILVVDDEAVIRDGLRRVLESIGCQVQTSDSGYAAIETLQEEGFHVVVTDLKMPGMGGLEVLKVIRVLQPEVPVIIITGYSTVETAVEAMKLGAFDYLAKPFTPEQITEKIQKAMDHRGLLLEQYRPDIAVKKLKGPTAIIGESEAMQKVFRRINQVAPTDSTVLIAGDSGTGKELVARAIHDNSQRDNRPFIAVDCTSLVESLLESELFGHVKGSFTGAIKTKTGLFKVADSGTLFLDEVSNLSLTTQSKLLRVLQEREIVPIGGTEPISIDIRLIAATNRNLKEMVKAGLFREDLFFRLNIIPINLPLLREREGDLPLLISHFLRKCADDVGKDIRGISPAAIAKLKQYPFSGNVRELENIIERAVVLTTGDLIDSDDLEIQFPEVDGDSGEKNYVPETAQDLKRTKKRIRETAVESVEKAFLINALERNNWNITKAAQEVGMQRTNFQAMLKKQGISAKSKEK